MKARPPTASPDSGAGIPSGSAKSADSARAGLLQRFRAACWPETAARQTAHRDGWPAVRRRAWPPCAREAEDRPARAGIHATPMSRSAAPATPASGPGRSTYSAAPAADAGARRVVPANQQIRACRGESLQRSGMARASETRSRAGCEKDTGGRIGAPRWDIAMSRASAVTADAAASAELPPGP